MGKNHNNSKFQDVPTLYDTAVKKLSNEIITMQDLCAAMHDSTCSSDLNEDGRMLAKMLFVNFYQKLVETNTISAVCMAELLSSNLGGVYDDLAVCCHFVDPQHIQFTREVAKEYFINPHYRRHSDGTYHCGYLRLIEFIPTKLLLKLKAYLDANPGDVGALREECKLQPGVFDSFMANLKEVDESVGYKASEVLDQLNELLPSELKKERNVTVSGKALSPAITTDVSTLDSDDMVQAPSKKAAAITSADEVSSDNVTVTDNHKTKEKSVFVAEPAMFGGHTAHSQADESSDSEEDDSDGFIMVKPLASDETLDSEHDSGDEFVMVKPLASDEENEEDGFLLLTTSPGPGN